MSTATDNASMDTNRTSGKDNPDHARLKKIKSQKSEGHVDGGHGPPTKDIGTLYYDRKFFQIQNFLLD